jgi:hypothetical protein
MQLASELQSASVKQQPGSGTPLMTTLQRPLQVAE